MLNSAPFAIKVSHNIFGFSFVLTLFGFQLSRFLQMSVVSRSKRVVLCGRPNIAGNRRALDEVAWDFFKRRVERSARLLSKMPSGILLNVSALCEVAGF